VSQVHVIRLLRKRSERKTVKEGKAVAEVAMDELLATFEGTSIAATQGELARLLREE
jgi:hypothetical protein